MECQSGKNSRRKNQEPRNNFVNQENNISCPRLLCIAARTFIRTQDVLNTCVKMKICMQE